MIEKQKAGEFTHWLPEPLGLLVLRYREGMIIESGFAAPAMASPATRKDAASAPDIPVLTDDRECPDLLALLAEAPFLMGGTPFQQEVWHAIRAIPCGQVLTYKVLAERIGRPSAVRAVAAACAANRLALIVPCHRVVSSDGGLAGFRWGLERKRVLLAIEARALQASGR
jgi:AraC family transcriptional regulator of adaptative response/methylated-DNA-[protein]-cysteine methyltransferase